MDDVRIYFRNFYKPLLFLLGLLFAGSVGYRVIEDLSPLDSLYMTVITLSTVGFREVRPLSDGGKIFTMLLVTSGIVFYGFTVNRIFRVFLEHSLSDMIRGVRMSQKIARMSEHYIICGGGTTAATIAEELERAGRPFVILEKDPKIAAERMEQWPVLEADALDEDSLEAAGIKNASGLASVLSSDADNLFVVLSARKLNPDLVIQTRIESEKTRSKMLQAGANLVVSPKRVGGVQIARSFLNPEVHNLLAVVLDRASSLEFEMKVHTITESDSYAGKMLRATDFRQQGYMVIGVRYPGGRMQFAPTADFLLEPACDVFLLGPGPNAGKPTPA